MIRLSEGIFLGSLKEVAQESRISHRLARPRTPERIYEYIREFLNSNAQSSIPTAALAAPGKAPSAEERLKALEKLRAARLVNEKEYQAQRQRILDVRRQ